MPANRKKATTHNPRSRTAATAAPWVEILPRPAKLVGRKDYCCLCERFVQDRREDPLAIIPVVYLVNPIYRPEAQRTEVGRLCQNCLACMQGDSPEDYTKRLNGMIYWLQQRIDRIATVRDHPRVIQPEEVWVTAAAEGLAHAHQNLTDLAIATGLSREEVVRRLIQQAKPSDLRRPDDADLSGLR